MVPFLEQLALALRRHHPDDLADVAVVMPVRGAAAVLRKYIAQGSERPQWSPDIMDMGGFMQRASGMRQGAPVEMLAHLYRAHTAIARAKAEPFDEMLQWAPTTLRDMSEVDEHLLDLDVFYRELQEIDDIEEWSFRLGEPSPGQQRLMRHWRQTAALHRAMHQRMRAEGAGTAGMVARTAVERITEGHLPWNAVWFAGLPRLAPAAAQVVALLQQRGLAQVAWDTDRHYLDDPLQEAGLHLRQAIARAGPGLIPPQNAIHERPRTLHATTVPNDPAQALHAAALLAAMTDAERADTAIVLADPELLMPLLQAWPAVAADARVAMGLPLAALPVHGLMEAFMRLHTLPGPQDELPVPDVERLLAHALVQRGPGDRAAIAALRAEARPGITPGRLATIISAHGRHDAHDLVDALRPVADPVAEMPDRTTALIAWAQGRCADDPWGREQLFRMAALQARLDMALRQARLPAMGMRAYATLRARLLREEQLHFEARATAGPLIASPAEAHLAARRITIVLGAREGLLPPAEAPQSWIPFEVRRHHGLPMAHDIAAITAYRMAQLLGRSERMHLVHANAANGGGPTRYLAQWAHELAGHGATTLHHDVRTATLPARPMAQVAVAKTGDAARLLEDRISRGLSPTALGDWLQCPLGMFHTHVLGLRERAAADGRMGSDVLGSEVHAVMEATYSPWTGRRLRPEELRQAAADVHQRLMEGARRQWPAAVVERGHHRLKLEMAARAMERYLLAEAERCARQATVPLLVEARVRAVLPNGVELHGQLDRVEERDGVPYVLDLKTGAASADQLRLDGLGREHLTADRRFALQLLVYAWAYLEQHPGTPLVRAAIVPLREADTGAGRPLMLEGGPDIHRDRLPAIAELLTGLVEEMRDPATPFMHDPRSPYCTACVEAV